MSEQPTTTDVPKSEDKPTEVTPVVEPSPETKTDAPAPAPVRFPPSVSPASFILTAPI